MGDEWKYELKPFTPRYIPPEVNEALSREGAVEDTADKLYHLGIESVVNMQCDAIGDRILVGPALTARYLPRRTSGTDARLGHDIIATQAVPGAILLIEARGYRGSVLGGNAALKLKRSGIAACLVDGMARDSKEIKDIGFAVGAKEWGIGSGRSFTELTEVGGSICFQKIAVAPGDTVVANAYGFVVIPAFLPWNEVLG
ncbi:hypothetical protein ACOALA_03010 [Alicyclobacillus acidoterrestris]|uniref:RraA family protein n=1 Tax=Alicyclobacillus acidoterrestris TaxID=1450 RepID=UPI003F52EB9A